jgi:hypothetical protein
VATLKMKTTSPKLFIERLREAERVYRDVEKPSVEGEVVRLSVEDILTDTTLFQPREFAYGWEEEDQDHVGKLAKAIRNVGELDPVSVIKLWKGAWYCVDGHHRLEAYKQEGRREPIDCVWASGRSVRDIVVSAAKTNSKINLPLDNTARQNMAWCFTLLGGMSKKQIMDASGVSDGQVGLMRRVAAAFKEPGPMKDKLRKLAPRGAQSIDWLQARAAYVGIEDKAVDLEQMAQRLARALNARMTDKLSKDPLVGARALAIYSRELVTHIRNASEEELDGLGELVEDYDDPPTL